MKRQDDEKRERRRTWWLCRWENFKLYLFSVFGVAFLLVLPDLRDGLQGVKLYVPSWAEIGVALAVALVALVLDEELGGDKLIRNQSVLRRKRKHAFIAGISALAIISKLLGG